MKAVAAYIITLTALAAAFAITGCGPDLDRYEPLAPAGGEFIIDASSIRPGEVRFYRYAYSGTEVRFLAARTASSEIRTAFDACVSCYTYYKGYVCTDGSVVCVQCDTTFELDELGVGKGNCLPVKLSHRLEGDKLIIALSDVESGAYLFK